MTDLRFIYMLLYALVSDSCAGFCGRIGPDFSLATGGSNKAGEN